MAGHDDAKQASGQCVRACGALTRVRSACLWRAQRACATPLPQGVAKARSSARGQRGGDGRARRRKAGKRAVRVSLWRADACAQGVPVARTACVRYASSSGRGQSKEQRAWTAGLRSVSYQLCRVGVCRGSGDLSLSTFTGGGYFNASYAGVCVAFFC